MDTLEELHLHVYFNYILLLLLCYNLILTRKPPPIPNKKFGSALLSRFCFRVGVPGRPPEPLTAFRSRVTGDLWLAWKAGKDRPENWPVVGFVVEAVDRQSTGDWKAVGSVAKDLMSDDPVTRFRFGHALLATSPRRVWNSNRTIGVRTKSRSVYSPTDQFSDCKFKNKF